MMQGWGELRLVDIDLAVGYVKELTDGCHPWSVVSEVWEGSRIHEDRLSDACTELVAGGENLVGLAEGGAASPVSEEMDYLTDALFNFECAKITTANVDGGEDYCLGHVAIVVHEWEESVDGWGFGFVKLLS